MEEIFLYLLSHNIDSEFIKNNLGKELVKSNVLNTRHREGNSIIKKIRKVNTLFINNNQLSFNDSQSFHLFDPVIVLLELMCFTSSVGLNFNDLKNKKVLVIGSNYGIEVLILRCYGIEAYGIDHDLALVEAAESFYNFAKSEFPKLSSEDVFIPDDILHFISLTKKKYDLIIGRNLNPLAPVPLILNSLSKILNEDSYGLIQWDAIYEEDLAIDLYAPKKGIYYNESLRNLLDDLYRYTLNIKKPRARFLYLVK